MLCCKLGNEQVTDSFALMGLPNCICITYVTQIPTVYLPHQANAFIIYKKGYFPMVLQGLVEHGGRFTDIHMGQSEKDHDARIFRNLGMFAAKSREIFAPQTTLDINSYDGFPCLKSWMLEQGELSSTAASVWLFEWCTFNLPICHIIQLLLPLKNFLLVRPHAIPKSRMPSVVS